MSFDKTKNPSWRNMLAASGLSSKSITGIDVHRQGAVVIIEINYTGGPTFVKVKQNQFEVGGTDDWGTGTQYSV